MAASVRLLRITRFGFARLRLVDIADQIGDRMRKQYHIRNSDRGLLAWDVDRLLRLASEQKPFDMSPEEVRELDETFWFGGKGDVPTCRRVAEHTALISESSLEYPIIIDPEGRVMNGMHRVCKALIDGLKTIKAVRLRVMPEPDFVNVPIDELPHDGNYSG
ncbi:MAG TPA: hypothetical protein VHZ30_01940 [Verrucomicrobiae bacterium]|jgi:hypothetical protein|nr:hypothetical protein [Verrucomicrobiae bacterium]